MRLLCLVLLSALALPAAAQPVTSHPRLWVTQADLPRLRSWAVSTNPVYVNGLLAAANQAKANVDAAWNLATGTPTSAWHDSGSDNWEEAATEAYAEMFAFMSLVDPDAAKRASWAQYAHMLLMWEMNQAAPGPAANQPFRDPGFSTYNRANYWGEAFGLTVDWIYPSLTAEDKATIRQVFLSWAPLLLNASTAGQEHPQPVGLVNDLRLLGSGAAQSALDRQAAQLQLRWAANNYFLGHTRSLALMALSFDPADDPAIDPAKPRSQIGNSLTSYVGDVTGAWLYQAYAVFENAATVQAALGVPKGNISLGVAAGGLPVEGALYGESLGFLFQTLLALDTAGYTAPATYGPQMNLIKSPFWDQAIDGYLSTISPRAAVPAKSTGESYLGPIYVPAGYGDMEQSYITYENIESTGPIGIYDIRSGADPQRLAKARWIARNVLQGGPAYLYQRAGDVWGNSNASYSIYYFLLLDPKAAAPADPRPGLPKAFTAPSIGRILARSDWSADASWFTFRCSWETINHEGGDCGEFELYRKGTWLTKEWSGYAIDGLAYTPLYHNTLGVQNDTPATIPDLYAPQIKYGGQFNNGGNDGDASVTVGANDNWAYATADATNLYNMPSWWTPANGAMGVTRARRSIVWLAPDTIVAYDRATTTHANRFKRLNLVLLSAPVIQGSTARSVVKGQALTVQSLLPAGASLREEHFWKTSPSQEFDAVADLDPSYDRLIIEAAGQPADAAFLTVLQGADATATVAPAVALASTGGGTAYQGAAVDGTAVMFPVKQGAFASLSYGVAAGVTRHLITGLVPGAGYSVTVTPSGTGSTVSVTPGGALKADLAGVIGIGFPASTMATVGGTVTGKRLLDPAG